ncbi:hypothetical protein BX616_007461 [Lobosporangium transversale]|nr:hypothetical protein BX616_007461 [Lobosporangium transversale]
MKSMPLSKVNNVKRLMLNGMSDREAAASDGISQRMAARIYVEDKEGMPARKRERPQKVPTETTVSQDQHENEICSNYDSFWEPQLFNCNSALENDVYRR